MPQFKLAKTWILFSLLLIAAPFTLSSDQSESCESTIMSASVLVVGATGATGKHVVQQLLDKGQKVKVIVRSKERMLDALKQTYDQDRLVVTEASLLDLSDEELKNQVKDTQAVISCLGHNMDLKGLFGHPRRLVTETVQRLTSAMKASSDGTTKKFVLMGSDGVANPNGTDDERPFSERSILFILRYLVPPHKDNELAAAHLHSLGQDSGIEWAVVRPTDLIDGEASEYTLYDKPVGSLFGSGVIATRANVAKCMVDLMDDSMWQKYKFKMPVLHDKEQNVEEKK